MAKEDPTSQSTANPLRTKKVQSLLLPSMDPTQVIHTQSRGSSSIFFDLIDFFIFIEQMSLENLLAYVENDQEDLIAKPSTPETDPLEEAGPSVDFQVIREAADKVISFIKRGLCNLKGFLNCPEGKGNIAATKGANGGYCSLI